MTDTKGMLPDRECDLLFVYGTLRRSAGGGMNRLLRGAVFLGEAFWPGRLYLVDGYPGGVPFGDGSLVRGELYRLTDPETLAVLDRYEECGPEFGPGAEYLRIITRVALADGSMRDAWIYLYNRPVDGLVRIGSGDFATDKEHGNGKG